MSAFIVSPATIDKIVKAALRHCYDRTFAGVSPRAAGAGSLIGRKLFELNVEAVNHRYAECSAVPDYQYQGPGDSTAIQQYKAVQCLAYQCSEGDVPERVLFLELRDLERLLASEIIGRLPAYDRVPWDA